MKDKIVEFKRIVKYLKEKNLGDIDLTFSCYSDHTFTYNYNDYFNQIEVNIICSPSVAVLDKMSMTDLFNLSGTQYFEFRNYSGSRIEITFNINENVN